MCIIVTLLHKFYLWRRNYSKDWTLINNTHAELFRQRHSNICNYWEMNSKSKVDGWTESGMLSCTDTWESKRTIQYNVNSKIQALGAWVFTRKFFQLCCMFRIVIKKFRGKRNLKEQMEAFKHSSNLGPFSLRVNNPSHFNSSWSCVYTYIHQFHNHEPFYNDVCKRSLFKKSWKSTIYFRNTVIHNKN